MDLFIIKHKVLFPIFLKAFGFNFDFSISDFSATILSLPLSVLFLMYIGSKSISYYPNALQNVVEMIYEGLYGIFYGYLKEKGAKYIPFLFSLMLFIFVLNLGNLLPGVFGCSSQLAVTLTLGLMVFFIVLIIGIYEYRSKFFHLFIPAGIPGILKPFLLLLEMFSFAIRPFSLALRLAINMIAGHVMLHVIGGFGKGVVGIKVLTIAISSVLSIFEIVVAGLQAYVFAVLSCIYIADILYGHIE